MGSFSCAPESEGIFGSCLTHHSPSVTSQWSLVRDHDWFDDTTHIKELSTRCFPIALCSFNMLNGVPSRWLTRTLLHIFQYDIFSITSTLAAFRMNGDLKIVLKVLKQPKMILKNCYLVCSKTLPLNTPKNLLFCALLRMFNGPF